MLAFSSSLVGQHSIEGAECGVLQTMSAQV